MAIRTIVAKTKEEMGIASMIRYLVFAEDEGSLNPADYPAYREVDGYDVLDTTSIIIALDDDTPVGSVRLLLPNKELAEKNGWNYGLDIERMYSLSPFKERGIAIAELPRTCVLKEHRKKEKGVIDPNEIVIMQLYRRVYELCAKNGITHIGGSVSTYSDNLKDAEIIYHLARKKGLVDKDIHLEKRVNDIKTEGIMIDLFPGIEDSRPETIESAIKSGIEIKLPGIVRLLNGLGLKIIGEPVFYQKFDRYILPMATEIESIPNPALNFFKKPYP